MNDTRKKIENSLDVVGQYFGDIKEACIEGYFKVDTDRLSDIDEVIRCIKIYVILKDIKKLTGRKLEVLSYYLKYGFSKKTKKDIIKQIKITDSNLNNVNCELRKMGVINSVGYNQSLNEVSKDLIDFKEFLIDKKGKYLLIKVD